MAGALDTLMDVMPDIVERAQQLAKDKIAQLPIAGNQQTGPPTITNPPTATAGQSLMDKTAKEYKKTQQYVDWDMKEYTSSKDGHQKRVEARDEQWAKMQMESAKRDMLIYKQMVLELKMVLKMEKDKKVRRVITAEIGANEDIIKMLIRSGVPDIPLPKEIQLQITVEKNKQGTQQTGAKSPRKSKTTMEMTQADERTEEVEVEEDKSKNCGNRRGKRGIEMKETEQEGEKSKNRTNRQRKKGTGSKEPENKGKKAKNRDKQSTVRQETLDLFVLPDFDDDEDKEDDEDDDYMPPARKRRKGKPVPVIKDDDEDNEEDEEENGNGDDEEEDEDYEEEEEEGDDEDDDEDNEEDDEEITLQTGKADQRKQKKLVTKSADVEVIMEERRTGQKCANIEQASEFRKYIRDLMKEFERHVMKGKQVKKYLVDLIEDVKEACINMKYPGMDFEAEDIVPTFSDPSFKAWKAKLNGVQFADRNDLKEANTKHSSNIVTSDRLGKDADK